MEYLYKGLIPQSIAPDGAKKIGVYNTEGKRLFGIAPGALVADHGRKLYSVGLVSDIHFAHVDTVEWEPHIRLDKALTWMEDEGCAFVCNSGDMTNTGFYRGDDPARNTVQFAQYQAVCDAHRIPVYELCGNHESYVSAITGDLAELRQYTGAEMYYAVQQGEDLYLFLSQPNATTPMTDEALQWLYETLEANRNRRCFIFVHAYLSGDSGNTLQLYGNPVFDWWGTKTTAFRSLLRHYRNTILFHGHSHMVFRGQEVDPSTNYTDKNGFRSVHIPSLCRARMVVDGVLADSDAVSLGYRMDVYDDCIILNGRDFIRDLWEPAGMLKIDTKRVEIQAGTFTDPTGCIVT